MNEKKSVTKPWPFAKKMGYWIISPWVCIVLCLLFTMGVMTFMRSMGAVSNLLDPVAAGTMGFLYFVVLYAFERFIFTRKAHMNWLEFGLGAYVFSALLDTVLCVICYFGHSNHADNEDWELAFYLFMVLAIYTAIAAVFRLLEYFIEKLVRKKIAKKNEEKLSRYRDLQKLSGNKLDGKRLFKDEEK